MPVVGRKISSFLFHRFFSLPAGRRDNKERRQSWLQGALLLRGSEGSPGCSALLLMGSRCVVALHPSDPSETSGTCRAPTFDSLFDDNFL